MVQLFCPSNVTYTRMIVVRATGVEYGDFESTFGFVQDEDVNYVTHKSSTVVCTHVLSPQQVQHLCRFEQYNSGACRVCVLFACVCV